MTREEFVSELVFVFNVAEDSLTPETELGSLKAWDSMGILSVITLMRQVGSAAKVDQLQGSVTIGDLVNLAGAKN